VLVSVGVRVTADSVCVVVVAVGAGSFTTVVQDDRRTPYAGMRSNKDSFFICVDTDKFNSVQLPCPDGF
jgi:hypothetical protein